MKLFFSIAFVFLSSVCFGQKDSLAAPHKRFPIVPALQLLLADSTTKYTKQDLPKKKPLLLVLFNPDCEHCQHEAEQIVANKEGFQNIHLLFVTTDPFYTATAFAEKYGLATMENVVVAKDPYYMLISFYQMHSFPYLALYDKRGKLMATFEGTASAEKVLAVFKEAE